MAGSESAGVVELERAEAPRALPVRSVREPVFVLVYQAYRFALDPTPAQERQLASHVGARRFAFDFRLSLVKDRRERRRAGEDVEVRWTLAALRREWNRAKDEVAPWWAENSKEAASSGLADLADGFRTFWDSRHGRRAGPRVGFPRFERGGQSRESFRYTTGRFGLSGRTRVQLPRIGHVRTHEPTVTLQRKLDSDRARILSMTISRQGDRWFCSLCCEVNQSDPSPRGSEAAVGVDAGVRHLAVLSTGRKVENPRALDRAQRRLRRYQRKLDRQRRANNPGGLRQSSAHPASEEHDREAQRLRDAQAPPTRGGRDRPPWWHERCRIHEH